MTPPAVAADALRPATRPTMYFVGVSTRSSAIHRVFAAWVTPGLYGKNGQDQKQTQHAQCKNTRQRGTGATLGGRHV